MTDPYSVLVHGGQVIGDPIITRQRWKFIAVIVDTPNEWSKIR